MGRKPYVSVGMPVFNGEKYLPAAIESLLAQTFEDFELIICDNASTDSTQQICRGYCARDARIRYYRNDQKIGGSANFNRVLELAVGKYFKWAAHDDLCMPDFLGRCVDVLDGDPSVVLCFPLTRYIDARGRTRREVASPLNFHSTRAHVRFASIISTSYKKHGCTEIFGLHRSAVIKGLSLPYCTHADRILLASLSLYGRFHEIPQSLFCKREHAERTIRGSAGTNNAAKHGLGKWIGHGPLPRIDWYDPSMQGRIVFPEFHRVLEQYAAIRKAPLAAIERVWCYLRLIDGTIRNGAFATRDVLLALEAMAKAPRQSRRNTHVRMRGKHPVSLLEEKNSTKET
jgi:glycosyltransferase involved in cell wall biosynthesis